MLERKKGELVMAVAWWCVCCGTVACVRQRPLKKRLGSARCRVYDAEVEEEFSGLMEEESEGREKERESGDVVEMRLAQKKSDASVMSPCLFEKPLRFGGLLRSRWGC